MTTLDEGGPAESGESTLVTIEKADGTYVTTRVFNIYQTTPPADKREGGAA